MARPECPKCGAVVRYCALVIGRAESVVALDPDPVLDGTLEILDTMRRTPYGALRLVVQHLAEQVPLFDAGPPGPRYRRHAC